MRGGKSRASWGVLKQRWMAQHQAVVALHKNQEEAARLTFEEKERRHTQAQAEVLKVKEELELRKAERVMTTLNCSYWCCMLLVTN